MSRAQVPKPEFPLEGFTVTYVEDVLRHLVYGVGCRGVLVDAMLRFPALTVMAPRSTNEISAAIQLVYMIEFAIGVACGEGDFGRAARHLLGRSDEGRGKASAYRLALAADAMNGMDVKWFRQGVAPRILRGTALVLFDMLTSKGQLDLLVEPDA